VKVHHSLVAALLPFVLIACGFISILVVRCWTAQRPRAHGLRVSLGSSRPAVDDPRSGSLAVEDVDPRVQRIANHPEDVVVGGQLPGNAAAALACAYHGQLELGPPRPQEELPHAAELYELSKDPLNRPTTRSSGSNSMRPSSSQQ